ncbi:MAG: hypothetical protein WD898_02765 [Candidatus Paceibacterota bacterium]
MARIIDLKKLNEQKAKPESSSFSFRKHKQAASSSPPRPIREKIIEEELEPIADTTVSRTDDLIDTENDSISWSGPLFHHAPRALSINIIAISLFAIAALVQIFQENIITTIFFALLGVVVLANGYRKPEIANFDVGPLGVRAGDRMFRFKDIKSFWIEYEPELEIKELSLQFKKWYMFYVKIPLTDQNPVQIRSFLLDFIPEIEHEDTLADTLSRKLGI